MAYVIPNSHLTLYKRVPLVKNGEDVLFLPQTDAYNALASYAVLSYTKYTFLREEGAIRIEEKIQNVYGCNYIAFRNASHGNRLFFGFVDKIEYINENTTKIFFTIDPFPTWMDTVNFKSNIFAIRATPVPEEDFYPKNTIKDVQPDTIDCIYEDANAVSYRNTTPVYNADRHGVYFVAPRNQGYDIFAGASLTGVQIAPMSDTILESIKDRGGVMIQAGIFPSDFFHTGDNNYEAIEQYDTITINVYDWINNQHQNWHSKQKTSAYTKLQFTLPQAKKYYNLEDFDLHNNPLVVFKVISVMYPVPALFFYPTNYMGVADNLAEGLCYKFPLLPVTVNDVYTMGETIRDITSALSAIVAGAAVGGFPGAVVGAAGGVLHAAGHAIGTEFNPPEYHAGTFPIINCDNYYRLSVKANFDYVYPRDMDKIATYLTRYGWSQNRHVRIDYVDNAWIQAGEPVCYGSNFADELNARFSNGVRLWIPSTP